MSVQISDDTEVRNLSDNPYNMLETDKLGQSHCFVHPSLWLITWDPTQPVATRPLAIQKDGTWFCCGWDLTKNICEIFGQNGYIRSTYAYSPYGSTTTNGDVTQPRQWSSECYDNELSLVYYNYRFYNSNEGKWIQRDMIQYKQYYNLYCFVKNKLIYRIDYIGLIDSLSISITQRLMSGSLTLEQAAKLLSISILTLIALLKEKGYKVRCKACIPPVDFQRQECHTKHAHNSMQPHYHIYTVNQSPLHIVGGCKCFDLRNIVVPQKPNLPLYTGRPQGGGIEIVKI